MSTAPTPSAGRVVSLNGLRHDRIPGQRILAACRDRLVERLGSWLHEAAAPVSEELFVLADSSRDRLQQTRYLDLRAEIEKGWPSFVDAFRRDLAAAAERCQKDENAGATPLDIPDFAGLALVSDEDLSEHIVLREFTAQVSESCDEELYALQRRVAVLLGNDELSEEANPLAPAIVCRSLADACATIGTDADAHLLLLRRLERRLHLSLPAVYREINADLIARGILPDFKRTYGRRGLALGAAARTEATSPEMPAPAPRETTLTTGESIIEALQRLAQARSALQDAGVGPFATNASPLAASMPAGFTAAPAADPASVTIDAAMIRQFLLAAADAAPLPAADAPKAIVNQVRIVREAGNTQALGGLASVTIDIVATLFDLIFDDAHLAVAVKALISRLQIPVLKVAMIDPAFFADRQHPTRRFLASVGGVAMRWGGAVDPSDPFYGKLAELVERIQSEFENEVEVFGTALAELEAFVNERQHEEDSTALAAANSVMRREHEVEAWERAQRALQDFRTSALQPPLIDDFLSEHWVEVLKRLAAAHDDRSPEWQDATELMKELAWSVQAKKAPDERLRLVGLLPRLLAQLNRGFDLVEASHDKRESFFDALVKCHAAALRGDAPAVQGSPVARRIDAIAADCPTDDSDGNLLVTRSVDAGVEVREVTLVGASPIWRANDRDIFRQVAELKRGDWVEFHDLLPRGDSAVYRERLHWISPQRGILLFSNHRSAKAISITPEALARQIRDGKACILEETAIFERALSGALESLNAEAA